MNHKRKTKAQLIEYIQELETRNQHTENKLADATLRADEANYIIEHSETLDKDVVRLAQTAFDEKREATLRVEKAQELKAEIIAISDKVKADNDELQAISDKIKADDDELQASINENKARIAQFEVEKDALINWYLRAKPRLVVSFLEKAYSLPSSDHNNPNSRGTSDHNSTDLES